MNPLSAKELSERQEIVEKFQRMREQQQEIAAQMHNIDEDRREHKLVCLQNFFFAGLWQEFEYIFIYLWSLS